MYIVTPDNPKSIDLNCGDIIQFNVAEGANRKFIVREIVNETERIKFSAEPPKQNDNFDDCSIKNESCVYHNTESNQKKAEQPCVYCKSTVIEKNDYLIHLCKHCEDAPIHHECLNNFVYENLYTLEQDNVTHFELTDMFCNQCGNEYPKTFKHGEKKVQLLRFENDPQCPHIILENVIDNSYSQGFNTKKERGVVKGMIIKFNNFNYVRIGGVKQRGFSSDDTVLIGNSEDDSKNTSCFIKFEDPRMTISDINSKWGIFVSKFNPPIINPDEPNANQSLKVLVQDHL